jgi:hypothetical protein
VRRLLLEVADGEVLERLKEIRRRREMGEALGKLGSVALSK